MNLHSEYWDRSRALDGVGGDEEFLSEMAGIFSAACPTLLKNLEDSVVAKNYLSVADTAHLLGRAARNLAAPEVTDAALVVETMARSNELDDIINACYTLQQEAGRLMDALADFRKGRSGFPGNPGPRQT
jgi:HPt (histidine-containing phosphotransfer) domain-containing protein